MTSPDTTPAGRTRTIPRWAKVIGLLTVLALAIYLGTMWLGGGHGPGQHEPDNPPAEQPGPVNDHQPPGGGHR